METPPEVCAGGRRHKGEGLPETVSASDGKQTSSGTCNTSTCTSVMRLMREPGACRLFLLVNSGAHWILTRWALFFSQLLFTVKDQTLNPQSRLLIEWRVHLAMTLRWHQPASGMCQ